MTLHAGPFSLLYQNGFIRYLRYGKDEIIRMMYFALRDENWGTLDSRIENEQITQNDRSFKITYTRYNYSGATTYFKWNVIIIGTSDGEITFELSGECLETIKKNRAGFCILHPIKETRGQPCTITHPDGTKTKSAFPDNIDPLNPFLKINKMEWKSGTASYQLEFSGDVFETEDQRNWTDASFKTFCTPLDIPFPVQLHKGDNVHQRVRFTPASPLTIRPGVGDEVVITISPDQIQTFPRVGLSASTETDKVAPEVIRKIKDLGVDHYRIEVNIANENWEETFTTHAAIASTLGLELEIVIYVTRQFSDELNSFSGFCNAKAIVPKRVLVLSIDALTTEQSVINYFKQLGKVIPATTLGAGTAYNFTELNRNRFDAANAGFVAFSIHPQEHAFDNESLVENIAAQGDAVMSAKIIYPGKEICISPVALRKRFNPYSASPSGRQLSEKLKADPRQTQPFNGPWALGSLRTLALSGARSVTCFQTVGNQGVIGVDGKSFPVYDALAKLLSHKADILVGSTSSHPLIAEGFAFKREQDYQIILFNYTEESCVVAIGNIKIQLSPFAVVEITQPLSDR